MREARKVLRDPHDAEDAAQEALLRAWRGQPDDPARRDAWLGTIARREALRVMERRRPASPLDEEVHAAGEAHGWEERVLDGAWVDGLMAPLDRADRALLRMRYAEDMTQAEIARRLGQPEGTVKVRLHRLRLRLRHETEDGVP